MSLLLLVSMLTFFEGEVRARAAQEGIPTPPVVVVNVTDPTDERWAWVDFCPVGFECPNTIEIRQDVLDTLGEATMKVIALHEVLHIKFRDHVGERTDRQMEQCHARLYKHMEGKLDWVTISSFKAERDWWKRRHPKVANGRTR